MVPIDVMLAPRYEIALGTRANTMARQTTYLVQAFILGKGLALKADRPIPCKSAEAARRMAERMAPTKQGVVAFSTSGDAELGDYDEEPVILFRAGALPAHFDG
jgi:hypothetical protein